MKRFKKVYIEITNVCNLACGFCIQNRRKAAYLETESFKRIIDEVKPYTDHVYLHLLGEPLLSPWLREFLDHCGTSGLNVNLTTNGTLIQGSRNVLLSSPSLRKVSFSLHSYEANRDRVSFEPYLKEIMNFVKDASRQGIICELRLWNLDSSTEKGGNEENRRILGFIATALDLPDPEGLVLENQGRRGVRLGQNLYLGFEQKFQWPEPGAGGRPADRAFCHGLRDQIGILVDGTVVPCCLDSQGTIALGNILESPLGAILASERARGIYEGFSSRRPVEELCRRCTYAGRFLL